MTRAWCGIAGLGTGNGKIGQADRLAFAFARPRDPGDPDAKGGMELGADGLGHGDGTRLAHRPVLMEDVWGEPRGKSSVGRATTIPPLKYASLSAMSVSVLARRSYWIPGSYAPALSEKRNSFLRLLKNKGFKEERTTKVELYAIGSSTTLESNKSLR